LITIIHTAMPQADSCSTGIDLAATTHCWYHIKGLLAPKEVFYSPVISDSEYCADWRYTKDMCTVVALLINVY